MPRQHCSGLVLIGGSAGSGPIFVFVFGFSFNVLAVLDLVEIHTSQFSDGGTFGIIGLWDCTTENFRRVSDAILLSILYSPSSWMRIHISSVSWAKHLSSMMQALHCTSTLLTLFNIIIQIQGSVSIYRLIPSSSSAESFSTS